MAKIITPSNRKQRLTFWLNPNSARWIKKISKQGNRSYGFVIDQLLEEKIKPKLETLIEEKKKLALEMMALTDHISNLEDQEKENEK